MRSALILFLTVALSDAATYYVAKTGSDASNGSQGTPWLTIQKGAITAVAGDIVRVQPGTYAERVAITVSGSSGSFINFVTDGTVICKGFDLTGISYVRLIGFEITHTDLTYNDGIVFNGTCSHVEIIDNYIHDVKRSGISVANFTDVPTFITIRGNTIYYVGHVGTTYDVSAVGVSGIYVTPHHWLVEYNTIQRAPSAFMALFGTNIISRNNYLFDFLNSYWNASDATVHADIFQDGSDGAVVGTRFHVYERNFMGDIKQADGHIALWQDTMGAGDTNMVVRGNVAYTFGNGGFGTISTTKVSLYDNTLYDITNGPAAIWYYQGSGPSSTNPPNGALAINNVLASIPANSSGSFTVQSGTLNVRTNTNWGFQTPADPSFVGTTDPQFIDPTTPVRNFRLQAGSPIIGPGTNVLWVTSASSSGTTFNVNDGNLLIDGWGMVDGDTITVSGNPATTISSITGNAVTVATSVTWTNLAPVYWGTYTNKTIGAYPYGSVALTAAIIRKSGTSYTVTTTGDARGIWFYSNGIPFTWTASSPYTATFSSGTITAKAYSLWAQAIPVINAANGTVTTLTGPAILSGKFNLSAP